MPREYRIAVVDSDGRRSSVWKFWVQNSDVYIQSRAFGSDSKVSLHESGQCQWSCTSEWVLKDNTRKNADRHIVKWCAPRPVGASAQCIFRVHIIETELRSIDLQERLRKVRFVPAPRPGSALSLECYISPPTCNDPATQGNLPYPVEFSLPLDDGRWFVVLKNYQKLGIPSVEGLRESILSNIDKSYVPTNEHRLVAFTEEQGLTRGLIELCACSQ